MTPKIKGGEDAKMEWIKPDKTIEHYYSPQVWLDLRSVLFDR